MRQATPDGVFETCGVDAVDHAQDAAPLLRLGQDHLHGLAVAQ